MLPSIGPFLTGLGPWALVAVMAIVFAETGLLVGFFLPGDSLLFTAGLLTAGGDLSLTLWIVAPGVFVAAAAGTEVGYRIGRRLGPSLFTRPDSRVFSRTHAERAQAFFAEHGTAAVILARFVPVLRTFTPVVAGVARMDRRRFVACNLLGALLWAVGVLVAGYFLGGVPMIADHVEVAVLAVVALSLVPAMVAVLTRILRRSETA